MSDNEKWGEGLKNGALLVPTGHARKEVEEVPGIIL